MAKELLIYSSFHNYTAELFVQQMEEYKSEDVSIRVNSGGGSVMAGYAMIAKLREHEGNVKVKVDGMAASMAIDFLMAAKDVEALDVSRFMIHKASTYDPSEDEKKVIASINKDRRAALERRVNAEKFKDVTGKSLDDVFATDSLVDVWLTAKEAKKIGLINKIVKTSDSEAKAIEDGIMKMAASWNAKEETPTETKNSSNMTIEKLRAEHPELVKAVKDDAIKAERDRVGAWMAFNKIDPAAVAKGIESGDKLSQTATAEFSVKAMSSDALKAIAESSESEVETTEVETTEEVTAEAKNLSDFEAKLDKDLNLA